LKAINIIKIVVEKDMEIHLIIVGEIEVLSRYLLGRTKKEQENI
jgi:hypothetical protein